MIRVFIGYDSKEHVDWHVLTQSIIDKCKYPVAITPLTLKSLPMWRPRLENQSTEFSISRFLVPFLCQWEGKAVFMDSDMVVQYGDVFAEAVRRIHCHHAVAVVPHDYTPLKAKKFMGHEQTQYPRKNWSSFMVFNCWHTACRKLTPQLINEAEAAYLHQLRWCADSEIGRLPQYFNVLVDEPDSDPQLAITPYNIHYTRGSPMHPDFIDTARAEVWKDIYRTFGLPHLGVQCGDIRRNEVPHSEGTQP